MGTWRGVKEVAGGRDGMYDEVIERYPCIYHLAR